MRDATAADYPAILALDAGVVSVLSPLDRAGLAAWHARPRNCASRNGEGAVAAFVLALRDGARYDRPNYRWFASRCPRFLYIDRIVVSAAAQGRGRARRCIARRSRTPASVACPCAKSTGCRPIRPRRPSTRGMASRR